MNHCDPRKLMRRQYPFSNVHLVLRNNSRQLAWRLLSAQLITIHLREFSSHYFHALPQIHQFSRRPSF